MRTRQRDDPAHIVPPVPLADDHYRRQRGRSEQQGMVKTRVRVVPAENAGNSRPGMQTQVQRERGWERLGPASSAAASLSGHEQEAEAEAEAEAVAVTAAWGAGPGTFPLSPLISSLSHLLSLGCLMAPLVGVGAWWWDGHAKTRKNSRRRTRKAARRRLPSSVAARQPVGWGMRPWV